MGIIISGHSNGADHTGFVSKTFNVSRAIMIAGANDYVGQAAKGGYTQPAPWQSWPGATPSTRLYGFGVCGNEAHHASGICRNWHPAWGEQRLPGPWFRADSVLRTGSMTGYHKICSNGSLVDPALSN